MNRDEWTALAERCEKATGPDREIDIWIENYCGIARFRESHPWRASIDGQGVRSNVRPLTASLDAITALIGREFPQFELSISVVAEKCSVKLYAPGLGGGVGVAVTEALARAAAFCRAMADGIRARA